MTHPAPEPDPTGDRAPTGPGNAEQNPPHPPHRPTRRCQRQPGSRPSPGPGRPATSPARRRRRTPCRSSRHHRRQPCCHEPRPQSCGDQSYRRLRRDGHRPGAAVVAAVPAAGLLVVASAGPVLAAPPASLQEVMSRITAWLIGIAAALATLFLTYGAVRYMAAGGDPGNVEKAKTAWRNAALGYGLALLAPLIVTILSTFVS